MYGAERGYLDTKEEVINGVTEIGGWAAATNDQNQFIQVGLKKCSENTGVSEDPCTTPMDIRRILLLDQQTTYPSGIFIPSMLKY